MVQKDKRAPGRPREFDATAALQRATLVFWHKGYDATTIDDLTAATGLSRPSLYNAYGDKEGLFIQCLERYVERSAENLIVLDAAVPVRSALQQLLEQTVRNTTTNGLGCMLSCVVPASDNPAFRAYSAKATAATDAAIQQRLEAAIAAGELPADFPAAQRARMLTDTTVAIAQRARNGATAAALMADVASVITLIFGPPA